MGWDIEFRVTTRARQAGADGSVVLHVPREVARQLVDALGASRSNFHGPEDVRNHPGTVDDQGVVTYQLDRELAPGWGAFELPSGQRVPVDLANL